MRSCSTPTRPPGTPRTAAAALSCLQHPREASRAQRRALDNLQQGMGDMAEQMRQQRGPGNNQDIAEMKLAMVGLPPDAGDKFPSELSGGMKKRAGIARALALDPELLFLDEPTAGLDPIGAAGFDRLIRELQETLGLTVFLITHDLDTLHEICDRVAVLADRKVIAVGTIPELLASDHPWIQEYFNGPRGRAAAASHQPPVPSPAETSPVKAMDKPPARPQEGN